MTTKTRTKESTTGKPVAPTLLLAFELGERTWKLGFTTGLGQQPRIRQIPGLWTTLSGFESLPPSHVFMNDTLHPTGSVAGRGLGDASLGIEHNRVCVRHARPKG
jgi:hypothetical protein